MTELPTSCFQGFHYKVKEGGYWHNVSIAWINLWKTLQYSRITGCKSLIQIMCHNCIYVGRIG